MDLLLRSLRDGTLEPGHGPLLLLEDSLACVGGPAILLQAVAELAAAISQGRAQAQRLAIVALDRPPAEYLHICSGLPHAQLRIVDCFTDPYGWLARLDPASALAPAVCTSPAGGVLQTAEGLQQLLALLGLQEGLGGSAGGTGSRSCRGAGTGQKPVPGRCIVVDSLSKLLNRFGGRSVVWWLHCLQQSAGTSSLLCALHADLHPPQALASLQSLAAGWAQLQPVSELERSLCLSSAGSQGSEGSAAPLGRLSVKLKRRAGRARAKAQLYRVVAQGGAGPCGCVEYWDAPSALPTPQALAESAATAAGKPAPAAAASSPAAAPAATGGGEAPDALSRKMGAGMKLILTPEEEEARSRVQLPYEHQGRGAAYQTGDWRDYLPPEAGGHAPSSSVGAPGAGAGGWRLGHILYVRDSGSEHDSDEDPDDDLDL